MSIQWNVNQKKSGFPFRRLRVAPARYDCEYERCGVYTVFMANEPLAGKRLAKVSERKTKTDWAAFVRYLVEQYPDAQKITLVWII